MAIREILIYPQHKSELRRKSAPVIKIDREIFLLIQDLKDTLSESKDGVGLASPQINIHRRVIVVRLGNESDGERQTDFPIALINPQIIESSDERKDFDGCLSFPGLFGKTIRLHYLQVKGLDPKGKPFNSVFEGFNAVVVHHEIDHLDGVLFIDRIESVNDLYIIRENERSEMAKVPYTDILSGYEGWDSPNTFISRKVA
ncbi:MAG: peptide deformylase [Pelolinea sp.]|nr:peptide deformylase [Pelolinea sp.]